MPKRLSQILGIGLLMTGLFPAILSAATPDSKADYVFSAPPWESAAEGKAKYEPVAQYLSNVTGKKVVYQHPGSWDAYRKNMTKGRYDIVFDGAHFNDYRASRLNYKIVAKAPNSRQYVVIVNKKFRQYKNLKQLTGRTICSQSPPDMGTLALLQQFDNPARQPSIVNTRGWGKIYQNVQQGRCVAGILPLAILNKLDGARNNSRIVYRAKPMPSQAFSVGPRVVLRDRKKITTALTSARAFVPTSKLRIAYHIEGGRFAPTSNKEFAGMASLLKDQWGYY